MGYIILKNLSVVKYNVNLIENLARKVSRKSDPYLQEANVRRHVLQLRIFNTPSNSLKWH